MHYEVKHPCIQDKLAEVREVGTNHQKFRRLVTEITMLLSFKALENVSLEDIVIEFGGENSRWYYGTYNLPQFVGAYENLNAFLDVECPNIGGGCDDWDRWAHIDIKAPDGNWVQLIRYITPYGVACDHELNVTDYSSLLQGQVEFRVFIYCSLNL